MRHHKIIALSLLLLVLVVPLVTFAGFGSASLYRPFGARVLNTLATPYIACNATGPLLFSQNITTPYFIRTASAGMPRVGGYLLGLYSQIPDSSGTCYNPETGAPIPAYEFKLYGVSR